MHVTALTTLLFAILLSVHAAPAVVMKRHPRPAMLARQVEPVIIPTATEVVATEIATATATATAPAASQVIVPPAVPAPSLCRRAGCNSELCVAASENTVLSPCIWKAEFACYKKAECGYDPMVGACGWKQTEALLSCIDEATP
ncbi:hypothetical protein DFJ77DRAFT_509752 [Powellomyces hirtus]|nr:hypothetical protein DFJ77DRAFT_509752 [Powellomyces hirtus]